MVLGLTGTNGSGKTTVAELLQAAGFAYVSLSDEIRAELAHIGLPATRENLIAKGNELRRQFGRGELARRVAAHLESDRNAIVDSIRHPDEVAELRRIPSFHLVTLRAPLELRYERVRTRGDARAPASLEQFVALERSESEAVDPEAQNLPAVAALADATLDNDGDREQLTERLQALVQSWLRHGGHDARPGWDEYFMQIARTVALRSNCMKRKVAAVIVRDRRIIATGYNGTPRGVTNCNQGGCARCNSLAASGTRLDECVCSHAEENAIVQAAYHGISIRNGVVYSTFAPCLQCTKMIINAGLKEVVYATEYPLNQTALRILEETGVRLRRLAAAGAAQSGTGVS